MTHIRHWLGLVISATALATALVAIGCGSSGGGGTGGAGGGNNGAGGATGAGGSATGACAARPDLIATAPNCNNVVNNATAIGITPFPGSAPSPAGGTVLDGLYESTQTGAYGALATSGRRVTFVMTTLSDSSRHMLWNGEVLGAGSTTSFKADATVTIAGTQITNTTVNCGSPSPPPLPPAFDYTVSGSDLILMLTTNGTTAATTYTRRGCAP